MTRFTLDDADLDMPTRFDVGGIVGEVEIVDCVDESESPWFFGKFGFVLRNAKPLPFRAHKGRLGFFDVDESALCAQPTMADWPEWR